MAHMLLVFLLLASCTATPHRRPFRSIKAIRETIENYEEVLPVISYKEGTLPFPDKMIIEVPTQSVTYSLSLSMNHVLIPPGFTSVYYDEDRREVLDKSAHVNCYYQGEVESHSDWTAVFSICHGIQGEFGRIGDPESYFHLEPLDKENPSMEQIHAFYVDTENKIRDGRCGDSNHIPDMIPLAREGLNFTGTGRVRRQDTTRYVEWVIVNDNRQYISNGQDLPATVARAFSIANGVDTIFQQLNIRVVLTHTITFTGSDMFTVQSDPNPLLDEFVEFIRTSTLVENVTYDSIMLITGINIDGNIVGLAYIGTMCNRRFASGFSEDGGRSLPGVVTTVAHELGHNLNMAHDDGRDCTCGSTQCVMAAISNYPPPTLWSSCSIDDLGILSRIGGDLCLFNVPSEMGGSICGNWIREGNEVCDCGTPQQCTNNCCDAATCQLAAGAECFTGACCVNQTCQFQEYGTQCRGAADECDVAEYCTGGSGQCPGDDLVVDGTACGSNSTAGYCNNGTCPSHDAQCQAAFGSSTGYTACYDYNTDGSQAGNCGHNSTEYQQCTSGNAMCGQLQCQLGNYTNLHGVSGTLYTLSTGSGQCNSFGVPLTFDGANPGLVEDGTKCGDGMVCEMQTCVPLSNLSIPTCPETNSQQCSGSTRGVCNNRAMCSCYVGFTGDACQNISTAGIDECTQNLDNCAQVCTDTLFSFTCSCNSGYTLNSDGRTCDNINECAESTDNCDHICIDTVGSFTCGCRNGFTLDSDGRTCTDIDECVTKTDNCPEMYTCINEVGSYYCTCNIRP